MVRHGRDSFFVVGEGLLAADTAAETTTLVGAAMPAPRLSEVAELRQFRFSRIGPQGAPATTELLTALSEAITAVAPDVDGEIPAGFTYLGQFVDHDLTMDDTDVALGDDVSPGEFTIHTAVGR